MDEDRRRHQVENLLTGSRPSFRAMTVVELDRDQVDAIVRRFQADPRQVAFAVRVAPTQQSIPQPSRKSAAGPEGPAPAPPSAPAQSADGTMIAMMVVPTDLEADGA